MKLKKSLAICISIDILLILLFILMIEDMNAWLNAR